MKMNQLRELLNLTKVIFREPTDKDPTDLDCILIPISPYKTIEVYSKNIIDVGGIYIRTLKKKCEYNNFINIEKNTLKFIEVKNVF